MMGIHAWAVLEYKLMYTEKERTELDSMVAKNKIRTPERKSFQAFLKQLEESNRRHS